MKVEEKVKLRIDWILGLRQNRRPKGREKDDWTGDQKEEDCLFARSEIENQVHRGEKANLGKEKQSNHHFLQRPEWKGLLMMMMKVVDAAEK